LADYLKEDLRQIWSQTNKASGEAILSDWCALAMASGVGTLMTMAKTLAAHRSGILGWHDHPISSARLEGANNKIKTLKPQAYGYRDADFFSLRIMAIHESKCAQTDEPE